MPQQVQTNVENNFTKGLITEYTGLNFPENAATDASNCVFDILGDVTRRPGIDLETNYDTNTTNRTLRAINSYKWNNVGGDGLTQIVAVQLGPFVYFYRSSTATVANPLSTQLLVTTLDISVWTASGGTFDAEVNCEFFDGNGYLFILHPDCNPIYCVYDSGTIIDTPITVQIRDFTGVIDNLNADTRPTTLTGVHQYNLQNQGWAGTPTWATQSQLFTPAPVFGAVIGTKTFTVDTGIVGISPGQTVSLTGRSSLGITKSGTGTVVSYGGSSLEITLTGGMIFSPSDTGTSIAWDIAQSNTGKIGEWFADMGNYPSNADQWWRFKTPAQVFDPATTAANVTLGTGYAPRGHYIYDAFNIDRSATASVSGITAVTTTERPTNGCWFQGRIWYTGVNAGQVGSDTVDPYTWTENIYFSQIVNNVNQFGRCYQENDATTEELFDLLPTDGGVIVVQGSGIIYKLFPIANGLLVFASNGVWFITGSQGIGFTATDYTLTKISNIKSISTTSYVDVMGLPYFWNEEGIYQVNQAKAGQLSVDSIAVNTILTFYNEIPLSSKKNVRAAYDPINYVIQWIYRSTEAANTTEKYTYDSILNLNVYSKAFYPYTIDTTSASINSIVYVGGPGGGTSPPPVFKYFCSFPFEGSYKVSFAEEDDVYSDWSSLTPVSYESTFTTGYKLHGQGMRKFQVPYTYVFSRNEAYNAYYIQAVWDYASNGNESKWSTAQFTENFDNNKSMVIRRHRLRGNGRVLQIKVKSVPDQPFDIMGWAIYENVNSGV